MACAAHFAGPQLTRIGDGVGRVRHSTGGDNLPVSHVTCGTADPLSHEGHIESIIRLEIRSREIAFNVASCQLRVLSGHGAMTLDARCALACPLQGFLEDWTSLTYRRPRLRLGTRVSLNTIH